MMRDNELTPIMLGRDHHNVSDTDSLFRETTNINDGNNVTTYTINNKFILYIELEYSHLKYYNYVNMG